MWSIDKGKIGTNINYFKEYNFQAYNKFIG